MPRDASLRRALAAARVAAVGPCNTRCAGRGSCAFGRSGPDGGFCRERRPPRRGESGAPAVRAGDGPAADRPPT